MMMMKPPPLSIKPPPQKCLKKVSPPGGLNRGFTVIGSLYPVRSPCTDRYLDLFSFERTLYFSVSRQNIELKTSEHKFTDRSHQNKRGFEGKKLSGTDFTAFQQNAYQTMAHSPNCIYCFLTSIFAFFWLVILQNPLK